MKFRAILYVSFFVMLFGASYRALAQAPAETGFLPSADYQRLKKVDDPDKGVTLYRYLNPDFDASQYSKIMIDSVMIYQTAFDEPSGESLSEERLYQARQFIDSELKARAKKRFPVVYEAGPDTLRFSIAITGMAVEAEGFKPRNILPVSAVLFAVKKATDLDNKSMVLVVEAKARDSLTGTIMGEGVFTLTGDKFRQVNDTGEVLKKMAVEWAATAVRLTTGYADNQ